MVLIWTTNRDMVKIMVYMHNYMEDRGKESVASIIELYKNNCEVSCVGIYFLTLLFVKSQKKKILIETATYS